MKTISIVVPVYYNALSLEALALQLDLLSKKFAEHAFEFIYVDDGSGDDSLEVLKRIAACDPRVRVVKLARNFGSNTAILAGLTYARGDGVGFIAADLQDPPDALAQMIELWLQSTKVVMAERTDRNGDPLFTRLFAGVFNSLFERLVFRGISPQGLGFFFIDRQVVNTLLQCEEKNAHLFGLLLWTGYPYKIVPYKRVERKHGKSRWTVMKKIKYFIDAFTAFSYLPIRAASTIGLLLAAVGGVYALALVFMRLTNLLPRVEGWTALMVVLLIVAGMQLIMLGVIGEYLWRSLDASRKRPLFIVDDVFEHPQPGD